MEVERYSQVMHLTSEVTGELEAGRDALDVLLACFPAGTLTGAPKVRAMELIEELEVRAPRRLRRRRRVLRLRRRHGRLHRDPHGGGRRAARCTCRPAPAIVFDSLPESELAECASKARALCLAALLAEEMQP